MLAHICNCTKVDKYLSIFDKNDYLTTHLNMFDDVSYSNDTGVVLDKCAGSSQRHRNVLNTVDFLQRRLYLVHAA